MRKSVCVSEIKVAWDIRAWRAGAVSEARSDGLALPVLARDLHVGQGQHTCRPALARARTEGQLGDPRRRTIRRGVDLVRAVVLPRAERVCRYRDRALVSGLGRILMVSWCCATSHLEWCIHSLAQLLLPFIFCSLV